MNTEVGGGTRTLKSINSLISATLVCVVLGVLAWVAAYLLQLDILYIVAGVLAFASAVPLFLMFQRVTCRRDRLRSPRSAVARPAQGNRTQPAGHPAAAR